MPADLTDRIDDVLAHLLGKLGQLLVAQAVQVVRPVDPCQEGLLGLLLGFAHEVRV